MDGKLKKKKKKNAEKLFISPLVNLAFQFSYKVPLFFEQRKNISIEFSIFKNSFVKTVSPSISQ